MLGEMLSKRNITIIYFCTVSIFIMNSYLNKWWYSFLITEQSAQAVYCRVRQWKSPDIQKKELYLNCAVVHVVVLFDLYPLSDLGLACALSILVYLMC